MSPTMKRAAAPAVILALAIARLVAGDPFARPRHQPSDVPPVSEAARAVLNALAVGDSVAGFQVVRIDGPQDGEIVIELKAGDRGLRAWITRRGARPFLPPTHSERFDLSYGPPAPGMGKADDGACVAVLEALAKRIDEGGAQDL